MTPLSTQAIGLSALVAWLTAAPAMAAGEPLVMAPPPAAPAPSAVDVAADVLLPMGAGYLAWRFLPGIAQGPDPAFSNGMVAGLTLATCAAVPPAALVALRDRPFAMDAFLASAVGGLGGLGVGFGAARLLGGGTADPATLAVALALGQGLGVAGAYHLYRASKPTARDLDRLPAKRKDDPIDDWKFWRERRNP